MADGKEDEFENTLYVNIEAIVQRFGDGEYNKVMLRKSILKLTAILKLNAQILAENKCKYCNDLKATLCIRCAEKADWGVKI